MLLTRCTKSDSVQQNRRHGGIVLAFRIPISWDIRGEMRFILTFLQPVKTNFCPVSLGANNWHRQPSTRVQELPRPRVFEVSFAKTSKIIFIPFSITFSPCVFWSQHDSPLLLSPHNRWLRHTEGKSVLALARSNATMRKFLHFWGWSFSRGYI